MAKSNPSLTSMTPHAAGERNFVDIHRDNTKEPTVKNLSNKGDNGMTGKSASAKVKVFDRKKFHFGNNIDQSIAGYDPKAGPLNPTLEAVHIRAAKRTLGKKRFFVDEKPAAAVKAGKKGHVKEEVVVEATRKDKLADIEAFHTKNMHTKMDQQMWGKDDPTDPDRTGEISFHHAMRAWAARQRVDGSHIHDTSDFKRSAKFSKEMQQQIRAKAAKIKEGEVVKFTPKTNLTPSKKFALHNKNQHADKLNDFSRRMGYAFPKPKGVATEETTLPWLKSIAEKKAVSENRIQVSDNFLTEKVALVKKIVLGELSKNTLLSYASKASQRAATKNNVEGVKKALDKVEAK